VTMDRIIMGSYSEGGGAAEEWKRKGNTAFADKKWTVAIECYSMAIDEPVPHERLYDEGPRRSVYHSNRAAAYLGRAQSEGAGAGEVLLEAEDAYKKNLKAAILDCEQALDLDSTAVIRVKTRFRKAQAHKGLKQYAQALRLAELAVADATDSLKPEILRLIAELKQIMSGGASAEVPAQHEAREKAAPAAQTKEPGTSDDLPISTQESMGLLQSMFEQHSIQTSSEQEELGIPVELLSFRTCSNAACGFSAIQTGVTECPLCGFPVEGKSAGNARPACSKHEEATKPEAAKPPLVSVVGDTMEQIPQIGTKVQTEIATAAIDDVDLDELD
ncbi:hypothetical protein CYMTET_31336, partial [Cymbomonas tetramitiformis]